MPYRGATIPLTGLMSGYISGQPPGLLVKQFTVANVLTDVLFRVTDPPTGGDLIIQLNDAEDGSGESIEVTIPDGETYGSNTGTISVGSLWQIVISEGGTGTALNLSGEYEMNSVTGVEDYFTTLERVKFDAKISGTDTTRDSVLNWMIAGVTRAMQDDMRRDIVQGTMTDEKIDGGGDDSIFTDESPILEITSLTENDTALTEDTDFESVGKDQAEGRIVRISGTSAISWPRGRRNIKTTYDHGYVVVPDSLVTAATALVVAKFNETVQSGKGWRGLTSKGVDPSASTTYDKKIWERETIPAMHRYRKLVL